MRNMDGGDESSVNHEVVVATLRVGANKATKHSDHSD